MLGLGPVSSVYDFLTLAMLLGVFRASPEEFRGGQFIESLATQTLVIFIIRTTGNLLRSCPSKALLASVLGSLLLGLVIVAPSLGKVIGFALLPPAFFGVLALLTATYLAIVQVVKGRFFAEGERGKPQRAPTPCAPSLR